MDARKRADGGNPGLKAGSPLSRGRAEETPCADLLRRARPLLPGRCSGDKKRGARKPRTRGGKLTANRILTTHVGSLVRPPQLVEFLHKIEDREPYDKAAYEAEA